MTLEEEAQVFDKQFKHNFGELNPIPIGARALCGALSTTDGPGETEILRIDACPICLSLVEAQNE